jgi:hypothetical protein
MIKPQPVRLVQSSKRTGHDRCEGVQWEAAKSACMQEGAQNDESQSLINCLIA